MKIIKSYKKTIFLLKLVLFITSKPVAFIILLAVIFFVNWIILFWAGKSFYNPTLWIILLLVHFGAWKLYFEKDLYVDMKQELEYLKYFVEALKRRKQN